MDNPQYIGFDKKHGHQEKIEIDGGEMKEEGD